MSEKDACTFGKMNAEHMNMSGMVILCRMPNCICWLWRAFFSQSLWIQQCLLDKQARVAGLSEMSPRRLCLSTLQKSQETRWDWMMGGCQMFDMGFLTFSLNLKGDTEGSVADRRSLTLPESEEEQMTRECVSTNINMESSF